MTLATCIVIQLVSPLVPIGFICAHHPAVWHLQSSIISIVSPPVAIGSLCACPPAVWLLQSAVFRIVGPPVAIEFICACPRRCGACRVLLSELLAPKWLFSLFCTAPVVWYVSISCLYCDTFLCIFGCNCYVSPRCHLEFLFALLGAVACFQACMVLVFSVLFSCFFSDVLSSRIWSRFVCWAVRSIFKGIGYQVEVYCSRFESKWNGLCI